MIDVKNIYLKNPFATVDSARVNVSASHSHQQGAEEYMFLVFFGKWEYFSCLRLVCK